MEEEGAAVALHFRHRPLTLKTVEAVEVVKAAVVAVDSDEDAVARLK